ncbi:AAA family ATPase, partial [Nocardia sp. NPDC003345]
MAELALTVRLNASAADARRGVIRLHPEVLTALGLREWDGITLVGARRTAAVAGRAPAGTPAGTALLDDVTLSNAGLRENATVVVSPAVVQGARHISVSGSRHATQSIPAATLRQALLGKVVTVGDTVSLLPRELGPDIPSSVASQALSRAFGIAWTSELLTVVATDPAGGPVSVQPNSAVEWTAGAATAAQPPAVRVNGDGGVRQSLVPSHLDTVTGGDLPGAVPVASAPATEVGVEELAGARAQAAKLAEWLSLALDEPELLKALGATPRLGVLITGPAGVGKATLARAVAAPRRVVQLDGPSVGAAESGARLREVAAAVAAASSGQGAILLVTDIDALLPEPAEPVATLILDQLRAAVAAPCVALLATTSNPAGVDPRLRTPDLCDRELALTLPTAAVRRTLLEQLLRKVPTGELRLEEVAAATPGFVVADLAALCREAALRAAARASRDDSEPRLLHEDLAGALEVIRPLSRSGSEELAIGSLGLDDVGDMAETKQALTETVLWPLRHPDSFARLGIDPPRGVLLYGPPGCGKTYLVRALAGSGQLSVHAVKGAELMDK